jgi:hypothetical protein
VRPIVDNEDWRDCRGDSTGYIYNDYSGNSRDGIDNNILHEASCTTLESANFAKKHYASQLDDALAWLKDNRRKNWKRCPVCAP